MCKGTPGVREGTVKDVLNDPYGLWVVVEQRHGESKTTKKEALTDQNSFNSIGLTKGRASENLRHEGKRKALVGFNPIGGHMQNVVKSISLGLKNKNKNSFKESGGLGSSGSVFNPSVKGKKGIARNKASFTLAKEGVGVSSNLKDIIDPEKHPSEPIFTFQSSMGQSH